MPRCLSLLCLAVSCLLSVALSDARAEIAGPYVWHDAVMRVTPAHIGSAYIQLENPTSKGDALTGATASWAERLELHQTGTTGDGIMTMEKIDRIDLPAQGGVALQNGGYHLMIFGAKDDVKIGDKRDITLHFEHAGDVVVPFVVQSLAAPMHGDVDHHAMPGM